MQIACFVPGVVPPATAREAESIAAHGEGVADGAGVAVADDRGCLVDVRDRDRELGVVAGVDRLVVRRLGDAQVRLLTRDLARVVVGRCVVGVSGRGGRWRRSRCWF